ncbi:MAG: hypothetical protein U5Q03_19800 [Bacteroidota bacterium]|nr:hypothetical protein [Bacteroidota bacterium]
MVETKKYDKNNITAANNYGKCHLAGISIRFLVSLTKFVADKKDVIPKNAKMNANHCFMISKMLKNTIGSRIT